MKRYVLLILVIISLTGSMAAVRAQESPFPLPAPLYILTSEQHVIRIDPATGEQIPITPQEQPVADFAISPDGGWIAYRAMTNNVAVISALENLSGYVLEFDVPPPPVTGQGQTLAWSPDVSRLAYTVPDGLRIALLNQGEFGEAVFATVPGGPWVDLRWVYPDSLQARDQAGTVSQIALNQGTWTATPQGDSAGIMPPAIMAEMSAEGVVMSSGMVIPGTAGALAFDWGPVPLPTVETLALPYDLYYLMPDEAGNDQVWRLPGNYDPIQAVTAEAVPVMTYAPAPDNTRIAYASGGQLIVVGTDGTARREIAMLDTENIAVRLVWSADGTQIAYSDARALWVVSTDGSQPPRQVIQHVIGEQASPADVRVYLPVEWHPDGIRLLVTIGLYEIHIHGVIDTASGSVTELDEIITSSSRWTADGQVVQWTPAYGYSRPGLYLLDPANPTAESVTVLDTHYPVADALQDEAGRWYVLYYPSGMMGPSFVRVLAADDVRGPFLPVYDELDGEFIEAPQLARPQVAPGPGEGPNVIAAGLRGGTYDEQGRLAGTLIVADITNNYTVQIDTPRPVHSVRWGQ